jgi:hypothetical protein
LWYFDGFHISIYNVTLLFLVKKRKASEDILEIFDTEKQIQLLKHFVEKEKFDRLYESYEEMKKNYFIEANDAKSLHKKYVMYEAERAEVFKMASRLYKRGIVEMLLQMFLNLHEKEEGQFWCEEHSYNTTFSSLMRHWRTCKKHQSPPKIITRHVEGLLNINSEQTKVENGLDNLYNSLSKYAHFNPGNSYPIQVVQFSENYETLAFLTFLDHYSIPTVVVPNDQPIMPLQMKNNDNKKDNDSIINNNNNSGSTNNNDGDNINNNNNNNNDNNNVNDNFESESKNDNNYNSNNIINDISNNNKNNVNNNNTNNIKGKHTIFED